MVEAVHVLGGGVAFADTSFSLEADRSLTGEDGVGGVSRGVWRPCCFRSSRLRVVDLNSCRSKFRLTGSQPIKEPLRAACRGR